MADTAKPIAHPANAQACHAEIARRYAWQAQQRRKREEDKPDRSRLITLIRLRELERLFKHRYGRFLPEDDAGMDDLVVATNHIAWLRGEVIAHIVAWARAWAPWLSSGEAERIARRVASEPRKFTADALAWRLRLSMAERTALKITTIGAFDISKAERAAIQKERKRDRERARRATRSTGRPRGRPRKNACQAGRDPIARHGFSKESGSAREAPTAGSDAAASTKETPIGSARAAGWELSWGKASTASHPSAGSRAASTQRQISSQPPPEVIEKATDLARDHHNSGWQTAIGRGEAERLIRKFWPDFVRDQIESARRHCGRFDPDRDLRNWDLAFRSVLDREYKARHLHLERRSKWLRERMWRQELCERHDRQARYRRMTKDDVWRAKERRQQADAALAVRARLAERRAERAVRDLYGSS